MKYVFIFALFFPFFTHAQNGSLQGLIAGVGAFINGAIIPFLLALAFLIFVINAIRYFVFAGDSEDGRENAKNLSLYSLGAFVFILSFWGVINLLVGGIGFNNNPDCHNTISDYMARDQAPCQSVNPPNRPNGAGTLPPAIDV